MGGVVSEQIGGLNRARTRSGGGMLRFFSAKAFLCPVSSTKLTCAAGRIAGGCGALFCGTDCPIVVILFSGGSELIEDSESDE